VEVADEGAGVMAVPAVPDKNQLPVVAQLPESGRGLAVMQACVDNVTLDSRPGHGTVVTMRKHIRWSDDAPLRHFRAASLSASAGRLRGCG
jgi:anti-sigma regulatory factor (Ser/Thr protein kinase)